MRPDYKSLEPRGQDTMRAVKGLTAGKEGQLPERGLGGSDGTVWVAMQCGVKSPSSNVRLSGENTRRYRRGALLRA